MGRLALPIYLFHVLFVHMIQAVGHREAYLPVCVAFDGAVFFAGLFGSGLAAWFLQKIPCTKWLVTVAVKFLSFSSFAMISILVPVRNEAA